MYIFFRHVSTPGENVCSSNDEQNLTGFDEPIGSEEVENPSEPTCLANTPEIEIASDLRKRSHSALEFQTLLLECWQANLTLPIVLYLNGMCQSNSTFEEKKAVLQHVVDIVLVLDKDTMSVEQRQFCDYLYKLGKKMGLSYQRIIPKRRFEDTVIARFERIETDSGYFGGYKITGPGGTMILQAKAFKVALHYDHGTQKPDRRSFADQVADHLTAALKSLGNTKLAITAFLTELVMDQLLIESGKGSHFVGICSIDLHNQSTLKKLTRIVTAKSPNEAESVRTYGTAATSASVSGLLHLPAPLFEQAAPAASTSTSPVYLEDKKQQSNREKAIVEREKKLVDRIRKLPSALPDTLEKLREIGGSVDAICAYTSQPQTKELASEIAVFHTTRGQTLSEYIERFYQKYQEIMDIHTKQHAEKRLAEEVEQSKQEAEKSETSRKETFVQECVTALEKILSTIDKGKREAFKHFFEVCYSEWFYSPGIKDAEDTLKHRTGISGIILLRLYHQLTQEGALRSRQKFSQFLASQDQNNEALTKALIDAFKSQKQYSEYSDSMGVLLKIWWDKEAPDYQSAMKKMRDSLGKTPALLSFEVLLWNVVENHYQNNKKDIIDFFNDMRGTTHVRLSTNTKIIGFQMSTDKQYQVGELHYTNVCTIYHWRRHADMTQTGLNIDNAGSIFENWVMDEHDTQTGTVTCLDGTRIESWVRHKEGTQTGEVVWRDGTRIKGWISHTEGRQTGTFISKDFIVENWVWHTNGKKTGTRIDPDGTRTENWVSE